MKGKRSFEPGDMVASFTGEQGMVLSLKEYSMIRERLREGRRPGHYFAPGCCRSPDYITCMPVLFDDSTFDLMRVMNVRRIQYPGREKRAHIRGILDDYCV